MRWLLLLQYALIWAELVFFVAVAKAVETMGPFPSSLEALQILTLDQAAQWLGAIGWTTEFIASFIYCMLSVLGVSLQQVRLQHPVLEQVVLHRVSFLCD